MKIRSVVYICVPLLLLLSGNPALAQLCLCPCEEGKPKSLYDQLLLDSKGGAQQQLQEFFENERRKTKALEEQAEQLRKQNRKLDDLEWEQRMQRLRERE